MSGPRFPSVWSKTTPATAAGRALLEPTSLGIPKKITATVTDILAIEAEAAAPYRDALAALVAAVELMRLSRYNGGCWCSDYWIAEERSPAQYHAGYCIATRDAIAAARRLVEQPER